MLIETCKLQSVLRSMNSIVDLSDDVLIFDNDFIVMPCSSGVLRIAFKTDLRFAVPFKKFFAVVSKIKEKDFTLELTEENSVFLCTAKIKAEIGCSIYNFEKLSVYNFSELEWNSVDSKLLEGISSTVFSASLDEVKPVLASLNFTDKGIYACDSFRLTEFSFSKKETLLTDSILLPAKACSKLVSLFSDLLEIAISDAFVFFRDEDKYVVFGIQRNEGTFPQNLENLLSFEGEKITFPAELADMLPVVDIFLNEAVKNKISVKCKNKKLICKSENSEGNISVSLPCDISTDFSFSISSEYFKNILKKCTTGILSDAMIRFELPNFIHTVALIKFEER